MSDELILSRSDLPLSQQPHALYLDSLTSAESRRTMQKALAAVASVLEGDGEYTRQRLGFARIRWSALRYQHTAAIRAKLMDAYSPATVRLYLSALRGVLYQAWKLGQMSSEDYQRAADLEAVTGEALPVGRDLSAGEIADLMRVCQSDHTAAGARDGAMIALLYACGLRRAELVSLELVDYDENTGKLVIRGKNDKQRYAYVTDGAYDALEDWLIIRGYSDGPLFVSINRGGVLGSSMTTQAVYNMVVKRGEQAGVENFSPHDFRRSFISHLLDEGADVASVSKMAGHANVQTTARYDRRPEETKKKAAKLLGAPYRKRG